METFLYLASKDWQFRSDQTNIPPDPVQVDNTAVYPGIIEGYERYLDLASPGLTRMGNLWGGQVQLPVDYLNFQNDAYVEYLDFDTEPCHDELLSQYDTAKSNANLIYRWSATAPTPFTTLTMFWFRFTALWVIGKDGKSSVINSN